MIEKSRQFKNNNRNISFFRLQTETVLKALAAARVFILTSAKETEQKESSLNIFKAIDVTTRE